MGRFNNRGGQHQPQGNQPQQVQIPMCHLQLTGLKAEFHTNKHKLKLADERYRFDCGFDLFPSSGPYKVEENHNLRVIHVNTALHAFIPPGAFGWITDRSSTTKLLHGGWVLDGKIDATYTGELLIRVACHKDDVELVEGIVQQLAVKQTALAQLVICGCVLANPVPVEKLPPFGRGQLGFGSTNS